jgi:hypothetical protein
LAVGELADQNHGERARAGEAARDRMRRRHARPKSRPCRSRA